MLILFLFDALWDLGFLFYCSLNTFLLFRLDETNLKFSEHSVLLQCIVIMRNYIEKVSPCLYLFIHVLKCRWKGGHLLSQVITVSNISCELKFHESLYLFIMVCSYSLLVAPLGNVLVSFVLRVSSVTFL